MRNLLFSFLSVLIFHSVAAQGGRLEIISANSFQFSQRNGVKVTKLIGNVKLKQESTILSCDSAYKFDETNYLEAYGNVAINHNDSVFLYGDELEYDGNQRKAKLKKNARMEEKSFTLTTTDIDYDMNLGRADYINSGKIVSSESTLTSAKGTYFTRTKDFYFKRDVVLKHPDYLINSDTLRYNTPTKTAYFYGPTTIISKTDRLYCESGWYDTKREIAFFSSNAALFSSENTIYADTLYYERKTKRGKAYRNIEMVDTANNMIVYGNYAEFYGDTRKSFVTNKALARQIEKGDTMNLMADTLFIFQKTETQPQLLKAYYRAKVYKDDMQSVCDSMVYNSSDSVITLYHQPVLWSGNNQITADTIVMFIRGQKLDSFYLNNNAFMISRVADKHFNQVKGKNMKGKFEQNKIQLVKVFGNGQSIYYPNEDSATLGVNVINCSEMEFFFNKNKILRSNFITEADATFYPVDELKPEELRLKGFQWLSSKRPDKLMVKKLSGIKRAHLYKF